MPVSKKFIKAFATHINKLRVDRELSFQQMADICDMDKAQVYKICTQGVDIKATTIAKIAKGFEITPSQLLEF